MDDTEDAKKKAVARRGSSPLRFLVSAREYRIVHQYALSRLPVTLNSHFQSPSTYAFNLSASSDNLASTIRVSSRLFCFLQSGLITWDYLIERFKHGRKPLTKKINVSLFKSPNLRLSFCVSLLLFLHRVLYRFMVHLRANLLSTDASRFRKRNPHISRAFTDQIAPAIGAGLAGLALFAYPGDQFRLTVAIYLATKAAEFGYNVLDAEGYFKHKPWWFGSWFLVPPAFGQLLHAVLFDKDCFPKTFGDFILNNTPNYVQRRPLGYPSGLPWPDNDSILVGLATIAKLRYPPFVSPILFPESELKGGSAAALSALSPVTSSAHPSIRSFTCALTHPHEPSCIRSYADFYVQAFPPLTRFFAIVFGILSLPRYRAFLAQPLKELNRLSSMVLRTTMFVAGAIGTSWASICLFQALLPRTFQPTSRFFWGGFFGGIWAFLLRQGGRGQFLYCFRLSADSVWKIGAKKGWWKRRKNGDVWLAVASIMVLSSIHDLRREAITSGIVRRCLDTMKMRKIRDGEPHEVIHEE